MVYALRFLHDVDQELDRINNDTLDLANNVMKLVRNDDPTRTDIQNMFPETRNVGCLMGATYDYIREPAPEIGFVDPLLSVSLPREKNADLICTTDDLLIPQTERLEQIFEIEDAREKDVCEFRLAFEYVSFLPPEHPTRQKLVALFPSAKQAPYYPDNDIISSWYDMYGCINNKAGKALRPALFDILASDVWPKEWQRDAKVVRQLIFTVINWKNVELFCHLLEHGRLSHIFREKLVEYLRNSTIFCNECELDFLTRHGLPRGIRLPSEYLINCVSRESRKCFRADFVDRFAFIRLESLTRKCVDVHQKCKHWIPPLHPSSCNHYVEE